MIPAIKTSPASFAPGSWSLSAMHGWESSYLFCTDNLQDCQGLDKSVLATHPLWTCTSPVFYPQSRQQAQAQQAMFPVSDIFILVTQYVQQSPLSIPILHCFLFAEGVAHIPPAKALHLCRNKSICSSAHLVLAESSTILKTVVLCQFRLEGWFVVCPRDDKHYLLGTLHATLFSPPFGTARDGRGSWFILSNMVYLL